MRTGRYLKPCGSTYAPNSLVSVIVESASLASDSDSHTEIGVFRRAVVCCSRFRRQAWTDDPARTFETGESFHNWLERWSEERRSTHVVSPIASNSLTLSGFWERITRQGACWAGRSAECPARRLASAPSTHYQFTRRVTHGKPDIITYRVAGRTITWTSGQQYFGCGEPTLERCFDFQPEYPDGPGSVPGMTTRPARDRARLWLLAMQRLCDWWREVKGGPWGLTVGQLAERYFLSRMAPKTICLHSDDDAKRLEAASLWGGRASVWFYGDVVSNGRELPASVAPPPPSEYPPEVGPLELWDVRSMYPTLLGAEQYPVKLITYKHTFSVKNVEELLASCGVIASVQLRTARPEYPYRRAGRVTYPTGSFPTVLAGPELLSAIQEGAVATVYQASVYQLGRPFAAMARELLDHRQKARDSGRVGWELLVKTLSNSFAGKLAAKTGRWLPRPDRVPCDPWGVWSEYDEPTGTLTRWRASAGMVELWEDRPEQRRSTAACFAYLTAHGRMMMRRLRERLPYRSVVSQDTDGLWLFPQATVGTVLRPETTGTPGAVLRVAGRSTRGRWFDARHYWTDSGWTLSGFHEPARLADSLVFTDSYNKNPMMASPCEAPLTVHTIRRRVKLATLPIDGRVGPSGWIDPLHLREGER